MLRIEITITLLLLLLFIISMLASMSHADIDCTYSLFSLYALLSHPQYNHLREMLVILIVVSVLVILSDVWVLGLMHLEMVGGGNRFFGVVWIVVEIGIKIALIVLMVMWRSYIVEIDQKKEDLIKLEKLIADLIRTEMVKSPENTVST